MQSIKLNTALMVDICLREGMTGQFLYLLYKIQTKINL